MGHTHKNNIPNALEHRTENNYKLKRIQLRGHHATTIQQYSEDQ